MASLPPLPIDPAREVSGPATGLLITGIIGGIFGSVGLALNLFGISIGTMMAEDVGDQIAQWISGGFGLASAAVGLVVAVFLIYASTEMKKLRQWGISLAAGILAMIPCISPCCLVGLPMGIWCLVVLLKPEVKASFR